MNGQPETKSETERKGLVDAADRILQELIRTPKFKETVIILLNSIDPPAARRLVRTLFWQDPGLFMSLLASLPALINVAFEALAESTNQMNSMPPPLVNDLLNRVVAGMDGAAVGEAVGGLVKMVLSLDLADREGALRKALSSFMGEFTSSCSRALAGAPLAESLSVWMARTAERAKDKNTYTHAFIQAFSRGLADNPDFARHVLKPLLEAPARPAARKTATKAKGGAGGAQAKKEGQAGTAQEKKDQTGTTRAKKK